MHITAEPGSFPQELQEDLGAVFSSDGVAVTYNNDMEALEAATSGFAVRLSLRTWPPPGAHSLKASDICVFLHAHRHHLTLRGLPGQQVDFRAASGWFEGICLPAMTLRQKRQCALATR